MKSKLLFCILLLLSIMMIITSTSLFTIISVVEAKTISASDINNTHSEFLFTTNNPARLVIIQPDRDDDSTFGVVCGSISDTTARQICSLNGYNFAGATASTIDRASVESKLSSLQLFDGTSISPSSSNTDFSFYLSSLSCPTDTRVPNNCSYSFASSSAPFSTCSTFATVKCIFPSYQMLPIVFRQSPSGRLFARHRCSRKPYGTVARTFVTTNSLRTSCKFLGYRISSTSDTPTATSVPPPSQEVMFEAYIYQMMQQSQQSKQNKPVIPVLMSDYYCSSSLFNSLRRNCNYETRQENINNDYVNHTDDFILNCSDIPISTDALMFDPKTDQVNDEIVAVLDCIADSQEPFQLPRYFGLYISLAVVCFLMMLIVACQQFIYTGWNNCWDECCQDIWGAEHDWMAEFEQVPEELQIADANFFNNLAAAQGDDTEEMKVGLLIGVDGNPRRRIGNKLPEQVVTGFKLWKQQLIGREKSLLRLNDEDFVVGFPSFFTFKFVSSSAKKKKEEEEQEREEAEEEKKEVDEKSEKNNNNPLSNSSAAAAASASPTENPNENEKEQNENTSSGNEIEMKSLEKEKEKEEEKEEKEEEQEEKKVIAKKVEDDVNIPAVIPFSLIRWFTRNFESEIEIFNNENHEPYDDNNDDGYDTSATAAATTSSSSSSSKTKKNKSTKKLSPKEKIETLIKSLSPDNNIFSPIDETSDNNNNNNNDASSFSTSNLKEDFSLFCGYETAEGKLRLLIVLKMKKLHPTIPKEKKEAEKEKEEKDGDEKSDQKEEATTPNKITIQEEAEEDKLEIESIPTFSSRKNNEDDSFCEVAGTTPKNDENNKNDNNNNGEDENENNDDENKESSSSPAREKTTDSKDNKEKEEEEEEIILTSEMISFFLKSGTTIFKPFAVSENDTHFFLCFPLHAFCAACEIKSPNHISSFFTKYYIEMKTLIASTETSIASSSSCASSAPSTCRSVENEFPLNHQDQHIHHHQQHQHHQQENHYTSITVAPAVSPSSSSFNNDNTNTNNVLPITSTLTLEQQLEQQLQKQQFQQFHAIEREQSRLQELLLNPTWTFVCSMCFSRTHVDLPLMHSDKISESVFEGAECCALGRHFTCNRCLGDVLKKFMKDQIIDLHKVPCYNADCGTLGFGLLNMEDVMSRVELSVIREWQEATMSLGKLAGQKEVVLGGAIVPANPTAAAAAATTNNDDGENNNAVAAENNNENNNDENANENENGN